MRTLVVAAILFLVGSPARALRLWGEPSDKKIRPIQRLSDSNKPAEVVAALTPEFLQSLRGTDLRQAYVLRGDNLVQLGRADEALGVYQLGVKLFPKNVDLLTRQAGLLHRTGLHEQAQPLFLKALEHEPKHFGAHLGLAEIFRRLGFLERSAFHYEGALETLDQNARVWRDYAETLLAQRDWLTADLALRRAQALEPDNPEGRILTGFARRAQGDLQGALNALDEALARGGGIGAKRAKALWLLEAGRTAQALAAADEVLRENPNDAAAVWTRSRVFLSQGQHEKASAALSRLASDPRHDFSSRAASALRDSLLEKTEAR
ncbi:MAG: tetratricopeptide repeat protein [Elusimicrobiota bacterium]